MNLVVHSNSLGCPLIELWFAKAEIDELRILIAAHILHSIFWIITKKTSRSTHSIYVVALLVSKTLVMVIGKHNYLFNCNVSTFHHRIVKILDATVSFFHGVHGDKGKSTRNTCMGLKNNMATNHLVHKKLLWCDTSERNLA